MEGTANTLEDEVEQDPEWKPALEREIEDKVVGDPDEVELDIKAPPAQVGTRVAVATQLLAHHGYRFATASRSSIDHLTIRFSRDHRRPAAPDA